MPQSRVVDAPNFDERYEIRGGLGSGGSGFVYRAFDRRLGQEVALKVLRRPSGGDLYRFKREFRALANIVHPNLVVLHELGEVSGLWFVAMELIEGMPFASWVRGDAPEAPDQARLELALAQLVDGLLALHVSGKLHRDIKSSNVLVTAEGRVVLLDFGLAVDMDAAEGERTHEQMAVGTPAYMSPEQAGDEPLAEASDWYSVGVVLYEALTGRRPFEGGAREVMRRKRSEVAAPPSAWVEGVPPVLERLCLELLSPEPERRPDGRSILATLDRQPSAATVELERAFAAGPFVGRDRELRSLHAARCDAARGGVTVFVRGESGIGKSRLVRRFLDEVRDDALVLEGRCYEREAVPYKALDTIIDALAKVLVGLAPEEISAVVPRDVAGLVCLFPVLRRVPFIDERASSAIAPPDPQERRRRAFAALRSMLHALARRHRLVVAIDDLQWGDEDSAVFLADLVHSSTTVPLLLVVSHRSDGDLSVVERIRAPGAGNAPGDVRVVDVGPLDGVDARRLVAGLAVGDDSGEILVRESRGHPLFLIELARGLRESTSGQTPSLEDLLAQRIASLPRDAAALLRIAAIAVRPLGVESAVRAAGVAQLGPELALLRSERLLRVYRHGAGDAYVEPYHDRIKVAAVGALAPSALRQLHAALARTLEATGETSDEALVEHWRSAGQPARAAEYALRAARAAEEQLAFRRAAALYEIALEDHLAGPASRRTVLRRCADALVNAGDLDRAAEVFADAARGADPDEAFELDRLQLEQVLRRGRLDDGLALARDVLARVGVAVPQTRAEAARAALVQGARLRLCGLGFAERPAGALSPSQRQRLDVLQSMTTSLSFLSPLFGQGIQARFLRAALDAGDPRRITVALAEELGYAAIVGVANRRRIARVIAHLDAIRVRHEAPDLAALVSAVMGLSEYLLGRWREALPVMTAARQAMRNHTVGLRWHTSVTEMYLAMTLFYLGEIEELTRLVPQLLRDARERGDVWAQHAMRGWRSNVVWLIAGRPGEARFHVDDVMRERTPAESFHLQRYYELYAQTQIDLYEGAAEAAWRRLEDTWPALRASGVLRVQLVRIEGGFLRARAALALAGASRGATRSRCIDEARRIARQLDREGAGWSAAFATQIRATIAWLVDRPAQDLLHRAEEAFSAEGMWLFATATRLRRGALAGGPEGRALADEALDAMARRGIAEPARFADLLCPWPA